MVQGGYSHFLHYGRPSLRRIYQQRRPSGKLFEKGHFQWDDYHLLRSITPVPYWSFDTCVWIDALRKAADAFRDDQSIIRFMASICVWHVLHTQSTAISPIMRRRHGRGHAKYSHVSPENFYQLFKRKLKELRDTLEIRSNPANNHGQL